MDEALFSLQDIAGSRFPLLEHAPDATIIVDGNGLIALVNAQTERLFGYYREELIGQAIETLIPQRFHARHVVERTEYASDPRVRPMGVGLELFGLRKDGTEFPVEISLSPIATREGTFIAGAIRDVTERKAFELRLQTLNGELESASQAKDRFLASMSHELRTPLNAIIGFTGTLLMKLPGQLNEEQERQLQIVQWSARHLLSLINDVLDLAKIRSGKHELTFERVPVRDVVRDVTASLASLAQEKGLAFSNSVAAEAEFVTTDRRSFRQILLNLAQNAIKYTENGSVRIDVSYPTQKRRSRALRTGDRHGHRHQGRGPRTPLRSVRTTRYDDHGSYRRHRPRTASFAIACAASRRRAQRGERARPRQHVHPYASAQPRLNVVARILVVDDNAANLDLMLYLLRAFGHEAEGTGDPVAALVKARSGNFDLVVTDILMPAVDGYEFIRRLRSDARFARTPVIAVTALAMPTDRERIDAAGFNGYITKPIDPQRFVGELESHIPANPSG